MRERLIELIGYVRGNLHEMCHQYNPEMSCDGCKYDKSDDCALDRIADYLLANGVIVQPCKVGDTVYRISTKINTKVKYIQETTISRVAIDSDDVWLFCACNPIAKCVFGKNVFLTREEAEEALKGGA